MKRLLFIATLLFAVPSACAQSGLISGRVVAVVDEGGQPMTEMPIIVDGDEIGVTGADGVITLPIGTFESGSTITIATKDDKVFVNEEDGDDCEDNTNDPNEDDDDGCVSIGVFTWKPGGTLVTLGDDPTLGTYGGDGMTGPGGDNTDDEVDDEDSGYGVELALGYNFDWGYGMITVRGHAEQPVESVPLGAAVGFDYLFADANVSVLNFMIDVVYGVQLTDEIDAYAAGGLRFFRWSYDFGGRSTSTTETGLGLRAGALYPVGPVKLFGEAGISFAYSSTLPEFRAGGRYAF